MFIPCLYHLENFPKIINIGWGVSVSEPKFKSDGVKADFRHEPPPGDRVMDLTIDKRGR